MSGSVRSAPTDPEGSDLIPAWIAGAEPPVPEAFLPFLESPGTGEDGSRETITEAAIGALGRALERRGRTGAFDLLAADAFVTYACEAALDESDPHRALDAVVERIVRLTDDVDGSGVR